MKYFAGASAFLVACLMGPMAAGAAEADRPLRLAQQRQEITTGNASSSDRELACTRAIQQARSYCIPLGLINIVKVDCQCSRDSTLKDSWNCVGTAICQK